MFFYKNHFLTAIYLWQAFEEVFQNCWGSDLEFETETNEHALDDRR